MPKKDFKTFINLNNDQQTDGQNNVITRSAYILGIFTENINCLSSIAAEKITFTP